MAITTSCARTPVPTIVLECYKSMLGHHAAPSTLLQLQKHLETVEPSLICAALEYTAQCAPRPTWAYANATISRQAAMGSRTAEDFNAACAAYRQEHTAGYRPQFYKAQPKQQFSQREYNPREIELRQTISTCLDMAETGILTEADAAAKIAACEAELEALGFKP